MEEGVRPGPGGLRDDMMALVAEWGFDPSRVRMPVRLIQAEDDTAVPQSHTDWWLSHIPHAEVTYIPGGHIGAPKDEADRIERELTLLAWLAADNT
jgi:pimeloyl-ACP methyl ester carboxylesterase